MKKEKQVDFKKSLLVVAKQVGKDPSEVNITEYLNSDLEVCSEWQLRKSGGFNKLKDLFFPKEHDAVIDHVHKLMRKQKNRIEAKYGEDILVKNEFLALFKDIMEKHPIKLHRPVKVAKSKPHKRTVVLHISDTHYGTNISKKELNDNNEFNWTVAARRTAFLFDQAVKYKPHHRNDSELVVLINGDIIAGVIHDQEWAVDLLTTQFSGTIDILAQGISFAAQHYKSVRVVCTPGNHGRAWHKSSKDRATVNKWDSYENMIYLALQKILEAKHKNVSFQIPESPYAILDIYGHKYFVTHGDTVVNVGNPGKSINMKSINEQINRANSQLLPGVENFAAIIAGHVHTNTIQLTDTGTMLLINGALSGLDAFAQSIGFFSNNPTQTIFEATPEHSVGDMRIVRLKVADADASLDKIIKPFEGKF